MKPVDAIKLRMKRLGLRQVDVAPLFGGKNRVSEVFSGKTKLTLKTIKKLHDKLGISYELLIK